MLLTLAGSASAQMAVHGRVISAAGGPVDHAQVSLLTDSTQHAEVLSKAISDDTGTFVIIAPSAGRFLLLVRRIGFVPARRLVEVSSGSADSVLIRLGDYWALRQVTDSIARVRHWERVAAARSRPRRWACGDSRRATREAADSAYVRFVLPATAGFRHMLAEYAMPEDRGSFVREFTRPLSRQECATFAEGLDNNYGLEIDSIRVFRFGKALFLPDWGDGGAFADWTGKLLAVFVIPS
jgi:hypothetical protein